MARSTVKDIDKGFRHILEDLATFAKSDVYIGINEGNFPARLDENGDKADATMAEIGATHEFGTDDGRISPRPWLRASIDAARAKVSQALGDAYSDIVGQKRTVSVVLNRLGLLGVNIVRRYMRVVGPAVWLPLAPATVLAKGSDVPLADTGQMFGSITYVIKEGKRTLDKSTAIGSKAAASGIKKAVRKTDTIRKKRAKTRTRRLATKSRRSESIKRIVAERRERTKVRKAKKRTLLRERGIAQKFRKKDRSVLKSFRRKETSKAARAQRSKAKRDRRARKSGRAREKRIALKFRKKDRSVFKSFRQKEANKAFRVKVRGKKNAAALLAKRKSRQVTTKDRARFRSLFRASDRAMRKSDKLLKGHK